MKIVGRLTGWRIAAVVCAGLLAPRATLAADQSVVVDSPITGNPLAVSGGGLHTVDALAQYRNNPADYVDINLPSYAGDGCSSATYTVPQGSALIITSIQGNFYNTDAAAFTGISLYTGTGCTGTELFRTFLPVPAQSGSVAQKDLQFANGIPVPAGSVLSVYDYSDSGFNYILGYLVPAKLLPAADAVQSVAGLRPSAKPGPSSR